MRRFAAGLAVIVVLALAPAAAAADDNPPMCPWGFGFSLEAQRVLGPLVNPGWTNAGPVHPGGGGSGAAREALGAQFTSGWFDGRWQGWGVAFAPGPLDAESARAAIVAELHERFNADQITYLDSTLKLFPTLYSEAELRAVQDALRPFIASKGGIVDSSINCLVSDHWRVEVTRWIGDRDEPTHEQVAEMEAALAPFGDKVRIVYKRGDGPQPVGGLVAPGTLPPAPPVDASPTSAPTKRARPRVADYVSVPRAGRCVHRKRIHVRAARRKDLASVTIAVRKRRVTIARGRQASVKLARRTTKVRVRVKLRDGRSARRTLKFHRCR